ncbi:hypothetical protein ZIOFF_018518 [Zingiber officinale]|uniref:Uncharacterized protein n=1 Tax=Zingiber officinale TaxID=94328 RepID=A0A8J5LIT9_ZINOF|nr:hypothetical protein ZIOFF_018518 [Zingiber officinale]
MHSKCICRPIPPSQVVLVISNTYGQVRKPVGFKFIASISSILDFGRCVAHPGNQPPPNHIVYCLHFDLVTSTKFSSCISLSSPSSRAPSAFSIWHVHYSAGSFYAHNSMDCPPWTESFDLHQILLCNPDDIYSKEIADKEPQYQQFEFLWMGYFENFISDYAKAKAHENVAAELKLELLSLSVLDNFCGTMSSLMMPLLDTTVTIITHGNFQAMNVVLICSIASSTSTDN